MHVIRTPEDGAVRASGYGDVEKSFARLTPDLRARTLVPAESDPAHPAKRTARPRLKKGDDS